MQKISKLLRNKSGIYCLVNLINGKRYVGSSVNIYNRLHEHLHNLQHNKAHNKHLQSAWNKYGKSAFEYAILQYCDKETRFELEQYYIDVLHPEYNLTEQVIANFGHSPSDECKQQISRTLKQKYSSGEITTYKQDHAWIPCGLYNIYDFQQVNHFKNIADASKYVHDLYSKSKNNLSLNKCKAVLYNKYCIISDLQLKESNQSIQDFITEHFLICNSKGGKYLIAENDLGNRTYFRNIVACSKFTNISRSTIIKHLNASKENPYKPYKVNFIIYFSNQYLGY